jgi:hypothetical protein
MRTAPPDPSHNEERCRASTPEDTYERTDHMPAEDTADESRDLTKLDNEDGEVLEEEVAGGSGKGRTK